ncbi:hypothetical protein OIU77_029190 [Salix suchowensis]|uniref:DYW domain-containing protein n=1 Tax=Salix suchowensis TaxID=1278906 RepID=A0ABQ9BNV7_9ROSI|nr:hypothetical protein OIU77_029190 [Salix suchowensis]
MEIINGMPIPANANVWQTLLAASRAHRNLELGKLAADKLISLLPQNPVSYVLLSNTYASVRNWQERAKVRKLMGEKKVKKVAGYSWIEVKKKSYGLIKLMQRLEELSSRLKDAGYQPDTSYVLQNVDEEHKEAILAQHNERFAIAFGLIGTPPWNSSPNR